MIATIEGILLGLDGDRAQVKLPIGLTMEVLLPAFAAARLGGSFDQPVTLHTFFFLEAQSQGTTIFPRLAGFLTREDRAFYQIFVTVKGIGHRRALRAMTLSTGQLAAAICDRDLATLQSLPEIGKRTAETIVTTLKGKVDHLAPGTGAEGPRGQGDKETGSKGEREHRLAGAAQPPVVGSGAGGGLTREAVEVLVQLGESRMDALMWIDRVLSQEDIERPADAEALVAAVYRLRG